MWHCNQHLIAKIDLPPSYMNLETGDTIRFDELIGGKLAFGQDYTQEIIKNGQPVYPIFFVNKITKSLDKISIEAIQIHRGEVGFDDEMASNYIIPNPYEEDIYEPEVETETILNVNWATGTNFATEPLTAIIDTDIQGDIEIKYWLREVNVPAGTVDLEYENTSSTYENGTWEIGEMPQEKIADPLLSSRPNQQVDGTNIHRRQQLCNRCFVDVIRIDLLGGAHHTCDCHEPYRRQE